MITTFTASISALGTHIRLVALQDDHEGLREIVLTLTQEECRELTELMAGQVATAQERQKAIQKAFMMPLET